MKKHWDDKALVWVCEQLDKQFHLKGKVILDVGCGWKYTMVKYIAANYAPELICGIDPKVKSDEGTRYSVCSGDAQCLPYADNTFDFVYSNATIEHIGEVDKALSEMNRVVKPRGKVYISFAPAWTSVCGYHGYDWTPIFTDGCIEKGDDLDENIVRSVPPWGHLYMTEAEMRQHLSTVGFQPNKIDGLIHCIYHNDFINRVPVSKIKEYIMNSGMIIRAYHEEVSFSREWAIGKKGSSELTESIAERICQAGYSLQEIGITHIDAVLEKYASL